MILENDGNVQLQTTQRRIQHQCIGIGTEIRKYIEDKRTLPESSSFLHAMQASGIGTKRIQNQMSDAECRSSEGGEKSKKGTPQHQSKRIGQKEQNPPI